MKRNIALAIGLLLLPTLSSANGFVVKGHTLGEKVTPPADAQCFTKGALKGTELPANIERVCMSETTYMGVDAGLVLAMDKKGRLITITFPIPNNALVSIGKNLVKLYGNPTMDPDSDEDSTCAAWFPKGARITMCGSATDTAKNHVTYDYRPQANAKDI